MPRTRKKVGVMWFLLYEQFELREDAEKCVAKLKAEGHRAFVELVYEEKQFVVYWREKQNEESTESEEQRGEASWQR